MNLKEESNRKTMESGDGKVVEKSSDRLVKSREDGGKFSLRRETNSFSGWNKGCE